MLVATLQFMERYLHVLGEELARMSQARCARSFQGGSILSWRLLTGMLGMLLLRSERAERVHSAMLARGWDGHPNPGLTRMAWHDITDELPFQASSPNTSLRTRRCQVNA